MQRLLEYLVGAHERTHPVVQVVMHSLVTDSELELLQKTHVVHHVQRIDDVKAFLLGRNEDIHSKKTELLV